LITKNIKNSDDSDEKDFLKIMLRLKDDWNFNMNDALISSFTTLSIDLEDEKTRYDELIPLMQNEIDLVNNINILSIFATTSLEYKKTLEHTLDLQG